MRMIDFDFYFVEDTFGANEELTVGGVCTPNDGRCTIDLNTQVRGLIDSFEKTQIPGEDGVFGVFDVFVLHEHSMAQKNRLWGGWWTVAQANTYPLENSTSVNLDCPLIAPMNLRTYQAKSF